MTFYIGNGNYFIHFLCILFDKYIDSTDRGLIGSTVSPWLYQSRAVAKRRPETDTARVILWTLSIRGLY